MRKELTDAAACAAALTQANESLDSAIKYLDADRVAGASRVELEVLQDLVSVAKYLLEGDKISQDFRKSTWEQFREHDARISVLEKEEAKLQKEAKLVGEQLAPAYACDDDAAACAAGLTQAKQSIDRAIESLEARGVALLLRDLVSDVLRIAQKLLASNEDETNARAELVRNIPEVLKACEGGDAGVTCFVEAVRDYLAGVASKNVARGGS